MYERQSSSWIQRGFKYLINIFNLRDFKYHYKQNVEIILDAGSPITYWKSPTHNLYSLNAKDNQNCNKLILKLDNIYLYSLKLYLIFSPDDINLP
ncbi:unnamed protein product [Paramecium sonneborni]|uniref:Uncharacterized protein n=1 Tax=Paramecium sonneborni TaxID=65129 RepID=A0A8S1RRG5_9CILI|nr:unnamed protein product [Paramecium sonneborni]